MRSRRNRPGGRHCRAPAGPSRWRRSVGHTGRTWFRIGCGAWRGRGKKGWQVSYQPSTSLSLCHARLPRDFTRAFPFVWILHPLQPSPTRKVSWWVVSYFLLGAFLSFPNSLPRSLNLYITLLCSIKYRGNIIIVIIWQTYEHLPLAQQDSKCFMLTVPINLHFCK